MISRLPRICVAVLVTLCACVYGQVDLCSDANVRAQNTLQPCLDGIRDGANRMAPTIIPRDANLKVYMDIRINAAPAITGQYCCPGCCQNFNLPAENIRLNPLEYRNFSTHYMRAKPDITFLSVDSANVAVDDANYYALFLLDISGDEPDFVRASPEKPWAHWIQYNILGLDLATGVELNAFFGTVVTAYHVFALYKQTDGPMTITDGQYNDIVVPKCYPFVKCNVDISRWVTAENLELVGVSWLEADENFDYSAWTYMQVASPNERDVCNSTYNILYNTNTQQYACAGTDISGGVSALAASVAVIIMGALITVTSM